MSGTVFFTECRSPESTWFGTYWIVAIDKSPSGWNWFEW